MENAILVVLMWLGTTVLGGWLFYVLTKAAVRNGILEADEARARVGGRPYAPDALRESVARSRAAIPEDDSASRS